MLLADLLRLTEKEYGVSVCLCPRHPAFYAAEALSLPPDCYLHHGPYCVFAKMSGGLELCAANKARSLEVAKRGRAFSGVCPNGLREYAQPVNFDGGLAAVVYAGHLSSGSGGLAAVNGRSYEGPMPLQAGAGMETALRSRLRFIAAFIVMELRLWLERGGQEGKRRREEFYLEHARRYIARHYPEDISLGGLAESLRVNQNYLGSLLRKLGGGNFRELLNARRIEEAKVYLRLHRGMGVSQIAALCGFSDSNYFSTVFKRHCGMPPRVWRRKTGELQ